MDSAASTSNSDSASDSTKVQALPQCKLLEWKLSFSLAFFSISSLSSLSLFSSEARDETALGRCVPARSSNLFRNRRWRWSLV